MFNIYGKCLKIKNLKKILDKIIRGEGYNNLYIILKGSELMKVLKKILVILSFLFFIVACGTDSSYIESVKSITNQNGYTVEEIIENMVDAGEFFVENQDSKFMPQGLGKLAQGIYILQYGGQEDRKELYTALKKEGIKVVSDISFKWEIEGKTAVAKIVKVTGKNVYVKFPVYKDGDYLNIDFDEIQVYTKSGKLIDFETIKASLIVLDFLKMMEGDK